MQDLSKLINLTGWQSWSTDSVNRFGIGTRNYSPSVPGYDFEIPQAVHLKEPAYGWCSWYAFWSNIDESRIIKQAEYFCQSSIPIEYILIDDGWTSWGDWLFEDKTRFPKGLKSMSRIIKSLGFKPGIWIAPFSVEVDSRFYNTNRKLLVSSSGKLTNTTKYNWFLDMFYKKHVLDLNRDKSWKFIRDSVDYLLDECEFELIKMDFLYMTFFEPRINYRDASMSLRKLLLYVRNNYPKAYTIACGCPLVDAIGLVDSMRIGPDTAIPYIEKIPFLSSAIHTNRLKKVIRNLENRSFLSKYYNLDPDAFVCRRSCGVSANLLTNFAEEAKDLKGNIFLGDDYTSLDKSEFSKYHKILFD